MTANKLNISHWLVYKTERVFLTATPQKYKPIELDIARNETSSFQAAFRLQDDMIQQEFTAQADAPKGWNVRVRRVGHVPVRHRNTGMENCTELDIENGGAIPGYVPDVLFDDVTTIVPPGETHTYWFTVTPAPKTAPGNYKITVTLLPKDGSPIAMIAKVTVHNVLLKPRKDFNITHWFYADSLLDWYRLKPFDERFWEIAEKYIRDYAQHGLDTLYVPAFTPPLDGVKRPTQLIKVKKLGKEKWSLDWTQVDRWIKTAKAAGITHFEWVHPFTQWGVKFAIRIYEGHGEDEKLLWPVETGSCSALYRKFLTQYCCELHVFLKKHNILDTSFFHVSDEPHGEDDRANYIAARNMLLEIAPWMKTMDALSEIEYGRSHLTDMPVPSITIACDYAKENITSWCYYCCGPRGPFLNRLLDTPLAKIAMHGVLFYRWPFKGFLHWGFNYWIRSQTRELIDVYEAQDGLRWPGWAYGDTTQVYPGADGSPVDSIRWEVFSESLQDYRLLQTLKIDRNSPILKKVVSFKDFPKNADWLRKTKQQLLAMNDK
ncbi:MAG: DUF4091 domain-containing protein [Victivallales bacterium]|nr:DUF4091 domain-containing protein [Victivallales bacterium]